MHIHRIWRCSEIFHTSNKDVGSSQWWSTASTMSSCHHFIATLTINYQNLGQLYQCNCVRRVHPYAYQQQWWCSNTFHTSNMDVGSSQWLSTASTLSSCYHFIIATVTQTYQNLGQLCQWNCVRVHPYAYPQQMIVLKHFIYIQYGCGMQSAGVCNLNHDAMTQFVIHLTPIFQISAPTSTGITV